MARSHVEVRDLHDVSVLSYHGSCAAQAQSSWAPRYVETTALMTDSKDVSRAARTRARTLDHDQRHENVADAAKRQRLEAPTELDPEKAGLGMFYCIECDRHFPSTNDREAHLASKLHKRTAKRVVNEPPYTQAEADRAAGLGVDNRQRNSDRIDAEA